MIETIDLDRDGNSCWILFPLLFERARINSFFFFFLAGNKSRSVRGLERFVRELDTSQCLSTSSHTASSFNYKLPSTGTMHIFSRAHLFAPRASIVLWKYIPYIYIYHCPPYFIPALSCHTRFVFQAYQCILPTRQIPNPYHLERTIPKPSANY